MEREAIALSVELREVVVSGPLLVFLGIALCRVQVCRAGAGEVSASHAGHLALWRQRERRGGRGAVGEEAGELVRQVPANGKSVPHPVFLVRGPELEERMLAFEHKLADRQLVDLGVPEPQLDRRAIDDGTFGTAEDDVSAAVVRDPLVGAGGRAGKPISQFILQQSPLCLLHAAVDSLDGLDGVCREASPVHEPVTELVKQLKALSERVRRVRGLVLPTGLLPPREYIVEFLAGQIAYALHACIGKVRHRAPHVGEPMGRYAVGSSGRKVFQKLVDVDCDRVVGRQDDPIEQPPLDELLSLPWLEHFHPRHLRRPQGHA